MRDKNGIKLIVGQIVRIEGGFFKSDNGLHRIKHAPENENWNGNDYCLIKVKRDYTDKKSKYNIAFYPLSITTNKTFLEAKAHNAANATIEVIDSIKVYKVREINDGYRETNFIMYITETEYKELQEKAKNNYRIKIELLEILNDES